MTSVMTTSSAVAAPVPIATASGYLALLQEDELALRAHALSHLLNVVDVLWHEVAEALPVLEAMSEDHELPVAMRQQAAAVASRVFFHLQEPTQALRLALDAGEAHFDVMMETSTSSPYVERLVQAALDAYIAARQQQRDGEMMDETTTTTEDGLSMAQLEAMVQRLLEASCVLQQYDHAMGIAMEAQHVDKVRQVLQASGPSKIMLEYTLNSATTVVTSKAFRSDVLAEIAQLWQDSFPITESAYALVKLYHLLRQPEAVAQVLQQLLAGTSEDEFLQSLQLSFDLQDSGDQAFCAMVGEALSITEDNARVQQVQRVLVGGFGGELSLSFMHKNSQADRRIMDNLKKALEERSSGSRASVLHTAAVVTHSYLYAGTTNDSFLRDHLDWMKKASNWAKFSATASLGIVHAGHTAEAMHLLQPYMPVDPTGAGGGDDAAVAAPPHVVSSTGGYAEGGALYALGLVHDSHVSATARREQTEFLRKHLRASHANEAISHGAALGVGLTSMGSADVAVVNELKELLDTDSAVAGEAAGIAIGMVLVGTGAGNVENTLPPAHKEEIMELVMELKNYARETQHEKIIRGIAMGLALMQFGQEENADVAIEDMRSDRDPVMRYGAMYALALAYCSTGSNKAIRILLHTAVSDVNDDVRMASVIGLAFVLFKTPDRVPQLVKLLLESFNPHVRYASCMAVGIAMAGTGDAESIAMLEPILDDMTDYVRQGALIGTSMIYMQQSDTCNGRRIRSFRDKLATIVSEKHQSTLTKMGAIMSTGIIDAGGRNASLQLGSRNGFTKMTTAVGLALWLQHWHWYPLMHMLSLALTPTLTIGLNKDFKFPKNFEIQCNSKPSAFAYPKKLEEKKEEKKKRVETVTLSTTAKEKARLARKRAKQGGEDSAMEVDKDDAALTDADKKADGNEEGDAMEVEEEKAKVKKKREPEPTSFRIGNPARITKAQASVCEFDLSQRYRPIRHDEKPFGVIMLTDSTPGEEEDLGAVKAPSLEPEGELAPPEPFEWTPPDPPKEPES